MSVEQAFQAWVRQRASTGRQITLDQYDVAREAFYAAFQQQT